MAQFDIYGNALGIVGPYDAEFFAKVGINSSDLSQLGLLANLTGGDYSTETTDRFVITKGNVKFDVLGSGFTYAGGVLANTGFIDSISVTVGNAPTWSANQDNAAHLMTAAQFNTLAVAGDVQAFSAALVPGDDVVSGSPQNDTLFGYGGNDLVIGNAGNNFLYGGAGNDELDGGAGNDHLFGGAGNDILDGGTGNDVLNGGPGQDWARFSGSFSPVFVTLNGNHSVTAHIGVTEHDTLISIENLFGSLVGDTLVGDAGSNWLYGYSGNDTLSGGAGADRLDGGYGNDVLTGGPGRDTFVFDTLVNLHNNPNVDRITDFQPHFDTIRLSDAVFTQLIPLSNGHLPGVDFLAGPHVNHGVDGQYIVYNKSTGNLYYDVNGDGSGAVVQIAHLNGNPTLHASDFFVI